MRALLAVCLLAASSALAQQPSVEDWKQYVEMIAAQRNAALNESAQLSVVLRKREEEAARREAEITRLLKLCGDPCKPKEEPKK